MTSVKIGRLFALAYTKPLFSNGTAQPSSQYYFYQSGAYTTQQTVYADIGLTTPLTQPVTADTNGRFAPVFLNPALLYSWQWWNNGKTILFAQADPVNSLNVNIPVTAVAASSTARANTTTLALDPYLTYAVPGAGTYRIELDLLMAAAVAGGTPGIRFRVYFDGTVNAAAANTFALAGMFNGNAAGDTQVAFALNIPLIAQVGTNDRGSTVRIAGTLQATGPGTLGFDWAQNISSASVTEIQQGSSMTVTRLA